MTDPSHVSRLDDPRRLHGAALDPLREVGLSQLTIQATLAGGLDAQALGVLAADLALGGTSGPGFPEFVYRFFNKLFRLDQAH